MTPEAQTQIKNQIIKALQQGIGSPWAVDFVVVRIPAEHQQPLAWLRAQQQYPKIYWQSRDGRFSVAGIGVTELIEAETGKDLPQAISKLEQTLAAPGGDKLIILGGVAFEAGATKSAEADFPPCRFVIPALALVRENQNYYWQITCSTANKPSVEELFDEVQDQVRLTDVSSSEQSKFDVPRILEKFEEPNRQQFDVALEQALAKISAGNLEKIVLARKTTSVLKQALDPLALLQQVGSGLNNCYQFGWIVDADRGFISVSPERLFSMQGQVLSADALGGSVLRGRDAREDDQFADRLLKDVRLRREHQAIRDFLLRSIDPFATKVEFSDPEVLRLNTIQHLKSRLSAELKPGVGIKAVIEAIHPTPAVCGAPREAALTLISEIEAWNRGWYAGALGCCAAGEAEFAVGIRSARFQKEVVEVYAGVGIVAGANANEEWLELNAKAAPLLSILQGKP